MTRPVIEGMRARNFGRIVVISSINGQKGQMGQVNYSAAKAGDIGFVKALAQENAKKGITVNAITPGYIGTDMVSAMPEEALKRVVAGIPVGRLGKPEEIAQMVVWLASEHGSFATGATFAVNGGQYMALSGHGRRRCERTGLARMAHRHPGQAKPRPGIHRRATEPSDCDRGSAPPARLVRDDAVVPEPAVCL